VILALSRTCELADFPGCLTVADWQQTLAETAWTCWQDEQHARVRSASLVVNFSDVGFIAPGPSGIYQYRDDVPTNGIVRQLPALYGLSVLDHIEAPVKFLQRAAQLLRPHGLLFLTFAFWDAEGEDLAAGAESRTRIYSATTMGKLIVDAKKCGFQLFGGGVDWTYHGNKLDDHSLASLVLTRR
jgi:hypothetical protein